jgi:SAM-dependent methyltransferase
MITLEEGLYEQNEEVKELNHINCPVCTSSDFIFLFDFNEDYSISKCQQCHSHFCSEMLTTVELENFYSADYFEGERGYANYFSEVDQRKKTFERKLKILAPMMAGIDATLEVGCANGLFVELARVKGYNIFGIDISTDSIHRSSSEVRKYLSASSIMEYKSDQLFKCIILFDTVEHLTSPRDAIAHLRGLLLDEGTIFIETPKLNSLLSIIMKRRWPYYRPPEHLIYFRTDSLDHMMGDLGFLKLKGGNSVKTLTLQYIYDEIKRTNPKIAFLLNFVLPFVGKMRLTLPTGSFWAIYQKRKR